MREFEVTCVTKPNRENRHEHITHIGNNANKWRLTRETVIQRIDSGLEAYYTVDPGTNRKVYIGVVREAGKLPYLRTQADRVWTDNLLSLAECSASADIKA